VVGWHAYVADGYAGLRVISVLDPTNPAEVAFYDTPGIAFGVAVAGENVYIANRDAGLLIVHSAFAPPKQVNLPLVMR
jgi:hypothetical protein